jgi:hypothetical protein
MFGSAARAKPSTKHYLILQCHLQETTHPILHAARLSRSQWVAKMIKPRCKVLKPKLLSQVVRSGAVGLEDDQHKCRRT